VVCGDHGLPATAEVWVSTASISPSSMPADLHLMIKATDVLDVAIAVVASQVPSLVQTRTWLIAKGLGMNFCVNSGRLR